MNFFDFKSTCAKSFFVQTMLFFTFFSSASAFDIDVTWNSIFPPQGFNEYRVWNTSSVSDDGSKIIVGSGSASGGSGGRLYLSSDGGTVFTQISDDQNRIWKTSAMSSDGQYIIAGAYGTRLYLSSNGGSTLTEINPAGGTAINRNWNTVAMTPNGQYMIAGVSSGRLYVSENYGVDWVEINPPGGTAANRAWQISAMSSDGQDIIVGVGNARLYLSSDGGDTWTETFPPGGTAANRSWFMGDISDDGNVLVVGINSGRLYVSSDGGDTWTETFPPGGTAANRSWTSVSIAGNGEKIFVSSYGQSNGSVYLSEDYGVTWSVVSPYNDTREWNTVSVSSDGDTVVTGFGSNPWWGKAYVSKDGGDSWNEIEHPSINSVVSWESSAISHDGQTIIAGTAGNGFNFGSYLSVDGGTSYSKLDLSSMGNVSDYWKISAMSSDGQKIITSPHNAGSNNGPLFMSENAGGSWVQIDPLNPSSPGDRNWGTVSLSGDGQTFIVGVGRLYVSTTTVSSWLEVNPPGGTPTSRTWIVTALSHDGQTMLAGVNGGRLYISKDKGDSWSEAPSPVGGVNRAYQRNSVAVSADGNRILVSAQSSSIWLSIDGGESFSEIYPPGGDPVGKVWNTVSMSPDGRIMLAGINNDRLYMSIDGGVVWEEVQPAGDITAAWFPVSVSNSGNIVAGIDGGSGGLYSTSIDVEDLLPITPFFAPSLLSSSDTGQSNSDLISNDTTPTFVVACSHASSTVKIYSNNPDDDTLIASYDCLGPENDIEVTTSSALLEGSHSVYYVEEDSSARQSAHSPTRNISIDTTSPVLSSAKVVDVSGDKLLVSYSEELNQSSIPDYGDFEITVDAHPVSVTDVSFLDNQRFILTLDEVIEYNQDVVFVYTSGINPLQDIAGNVAQDISNYSVVNDTPPPADWYNYDWLYRKPFLIDRTKISGTLDDFPFLFSITDLDFRSLDNGGKVIQNNGDDIVFTTSDGSTLLSHDIEYYNPVIGQIIVWIKMPDLNSSEDKLFYMYYGSDQDAPNDSTDVYDEYLAVYHMNQSSGGVGSIIDSTGFNNGTDSGGPIFSAQGQIGNAISLDGSNDYINLGDVTYLDSINKLTVSAWIHPSNLATNSFRQIVSKDNSVYNYWLIEIQSNNTPSYQGGGMRWFNTHSSSEAITQKTPTPFSTDAYQYAVWVFDGTQPTNDTKTRFWLNGVEQTLTYPSGNIPSTMPPDTASDLYIGGNDRLGRYMAGSVDEFRLSSHTRDNDWILTEYNNQLNPTSFYFIGYEQEQADFPENSPPHSPSNLGPSQFTTNSWTNDPTPTLTFTLSDPDLGDQIKYQIQIDDTEDFSSPLIDSTGTLASQGAFQFTPSEPLSDGSYYWRVRAVDDSDLESQFVEASDAEPAFNIDTVAPEPGNLSFSIINTTNLTVSIASSSDALSGLAEQSYRFENITLSKNSGIISATTWQDTGLSINTQYSYRATVYDEAGNSSTTATYTTYTKASALSSGHFTLTPQSYNQITATWTRGSNPVGTEFFVENVTTGTSSGWTTGLSWLSDNLESDTQYTFYIKARNGDGLETSSTTKSVSTPSRQPNTPTDLSPEEFTTNSWTNDPTPTLTFTLSDPDLGDQIKYQIQIDDTEDFSSPLIDSTGTLASQGAFQFTPSEPLSDGSYYWRVRAVDEHNLQSAWQEANEGSVAFKIDQTGPITGEILVTATTTSSISLEVVGASDGGVGLASLPYVFYNITTNTESESASSSAQFIGLMPDTDYSFEVRVSDVLGNFATTSIALARTVALEEDVPESISSPTNSSSSGGSRRASVSQSSQSSQSNQSSESGVNNTSQVLVSFSSPRVVISEENITITPIQNVEEIIDQPQNNVPDDNVVSADVLIVPPQPLLPQEPSLIEKGGLAIMDTVNSAKIYLDRTTGSISRGMSQLRNFFSEKYSESKSELESAFSDTERKVPEHLLEHRYETVIINLLTKEGKPMQGATVTLMSEPRTTITDEFGRAIFNDVETGEHELIVAFGTFRGQQELFFDHDSPSLYLQVVSELKDGISPAWVLVGSLLAFILGIVLTIFIQRKIALRKGV